MLLDSLLVQLPLTAALLLEQHESFLQGQFKLDGEGREKQDCF